MHSEREIENLFPKIEAGLIQDNAAVWIPGTELDEQEKRGAGRGGDSEDRRAGRRRTEPPQRVHRLVK